MDPECAPGDGEVLLHGPQGMPGLLLVEVLERKPAKRRMHFDLQPQTTRDEELARILVAVRLVPPRHIPRTDTIAFGGATVAAPAPWPPSC